MLNLAIKFLFLNLRIHLLIVNVLYRLSNSSEKIVQGNNLSKRANIQVPDEIA